MNRIRKEVCGKTRGPAEVRFEDQSLTSHAGLVVFQRLFSRLGLKERLRGCFRHESGRRAYAPHAVALLLVVHLLLGCRELRDMARYRNDEAVRRGGGAAVGCRTCRRCRGRCRTWTRAAPNGCGRWPGSWRWSGCGNCRRGGSRWTSTARCWGRGGWRRVPRWATTRGARASAATGRCSPPWRRPGRCSTCCTVRATWRTRRGRRSSSARRRERLRAALPGVRLEARMDAAFFDDGLLGGIERRGVEYSVSVPFARFPGLKAAVEGRRRWRRASAAVAFLRTALEAGQLEAPAPPGRRPAAGSPAPQGAAPARPVRAPRARLRVQGRGHQQARPRPRRGPVPRRPRRPGGPVRRTQVAVRPRLRAQPQGGRQPRLRPRVRARPQPRPRTADGRRSPLPTHQRQAFAAVGVRPDALHEKRLPSSRPAASSTPGKKRILSLMNDPKVEAAMSQLPQPHDNLDAEKPATIGFSAPVSAGWPSPAASAWNRFTDAAGNLLLPHGFAAADVLLRGSVVRPGYGRDHGRFGRPVRLHLSDWQLLEEGGADSGRKRDRELLAP